MSWRTVVIRDSCKLDYQMGYMVVRQKETKRVHLSEISALIIETTAVSITAALMSELVNRKISVIFCDEKRNPRFELSPFYGSYDTSRKVRKQSQWPDYVKEIMWTAIVTEKIKKQAQLLNLCGKPEGEKVMSYTRQVQHRDISNREGFAAKVYFNSLFGMDFTRENSDPINSALNYGYALLLSAFNRQIVSNGYITQIGLFHDNVFNKFNLSSDIMEPFRPIVDKMVYDLRPRQFETGEKRELQKLFFRSVIIAGRSETVTNAIGIYSKSVFNAIEEGDPGLIKFYSYEF